MRLQPIRVLSCVLLALAIGMPGFALTTSWTNAAGGNWGTAANWDNGVPGISDTANIALNGTYTVISDSVRYLEVLSLGATSGTQTLAISQPMLVSSSVISVQIGANGVLDISNTYLWATGRFDSVGLSNYGTIQLHHDGTIYGDSSFIRNEVGGLLHGYVCPHMQNLFNSWIENYGTLDLEGGCGASIVMSIVNGESGVFTIDDTLLCEYVLNYGSTELQYGARLGAKPIAVDWPSRIWNFGVWTMRGNTKIMDHPGWPDLPPLVGNFGRWQVAADTTLADDDATITAHFAQLGDSARLTLNSGNLWLPGANDTVSFARDTLTDSLSIAAGCTLHVAAALFDDSVIVSGAGTLHFLDGPTVARGTWPFSGGFYLTALPSDTTVVSFDPLPPPSVTLSSLNLSMLNTVFQISNSDTVTIGGVRQDGGTISGNIIVTNTYDWTQGTFTADTTADITIPLGVTLNVSTGGDKTLDSLRLNIEGSATMQDSGVFTLVDSAVVNVAPGGTLTFGPGFPMTGVGEFYNSGQATFDPQGDTIRIDVPVTNSTVARTPGTIDVLSTPVVFGAGGSNGASIFIHGGGLLTLHGLFVNDGGTMQVMNGGELSIRDTLFNARNSILEFKGGSSISGAGRIINKGQLIKSGAALLTTTNVLVEPVLQNDVDTGYVNVTVDTLTLLSGGVNRGIITIQPGAVLKILGVFLNDTTGVVQGGGVLDVSEATFTNAGTISPGMSPGSLNVNGGMIATPSSVIALELAGAASNQQDHLIINGPVTLGGTLNLTVLNGYLPGPTDSLNLLSCLSWSGGFAQTMGGLLSNGQYLDFQMGPNGVMIYACNSGTELSTGVPAIVDTVYYLNSREDTLRIEIANTGWCPLEYSAALSNLNPPAPVWIEIAAPGAVGVVRRTRMVDVKLPVHCAELPAGNHTAQLELATNDPTNPLVQIPITLYIEPVPAVTGLVVKRQGSVIRLDWQPVSGTTQYNIYRSSTWPADPGTATLIGSSGSSTYQDATDFASRSYYFVTAVR